MLLAAGSDPEARDRAGSHPLFVAAHVIVGDPVGVVTALIEAGANPTSPDKYGATPLHRAAESANSDVARLLLRLGADPNALDLAGHAPLHYAISDHALPGSLANVVGQLLAGGADPNIRSRADYHGKGDTPLTLATSHVPAAVVTLLIRAGADMNAPDLRERTPLGEAIGNAGAFAALLAAGVNIAPLLKATGKPALLAAAEKGNTAVVSALIGAGCDPNRLHRGKSALHLAVAKAHAGAVAALLAGGADRYLSDKDGVSTLDLARRRRRKAVLALIEPGV